jgi:ribosomal protein S12 methylthiotransferase
MTTAPVLTTPTPHLTDTPAKPLNIGFVHLGCPKNLVDTETMLGVLEADGHRLVSGDAEADLMLVNTCAFIDEAQKESIQTLVRLAEQGKRLMIAGCLAQKFQGELLDLFPEADAVVGTHNVADVASVLRRVQQGERVLATQQDPTYLLQDDSHRRHVTVGASVYVKISEGCDYRCSFCIIPSMRGNLRSRSVASVVDSVRRLTDQGVSEVVLVGQDNTSYGRDLDNDTDLPMLLEALNELPNLKWLRFMYAYPNNRLNDRLLKTIRDCDKVVKYLDCPLQHVHPDMLKAMRRPPLDDVERWADWVRSTVPNIKLRTTFIVGFPGETEAHVEALRQAVERVQFDRLGVFEYSDVDGASANELGAKVPKALAKQRRNLLMGLQQGISYKLNQGLVGQVLPVIIDELRPSGLAVGRTQWDAPEVDNQVLVSPVAGQAPPVPGEIVPVKVSGVTPYDLKGQVVPGDAPSLRG